MPGDEHSSQTQGFIMKHRVSVQQVGDSIQTPLCLQPLTGGWGFLGFYPILFMSNACYSCQHPFLEKQCNEKAIVWMEFWHGKCLPPEGRGWWRSPHGFLGVSAVHAAETRDRAVVIDWCESRGLSYYIVPWSLLLSAESVNKPVS